MPKRKKENLETIDELMIIEEVISADRIVTPRTRKSGDLLSVAAELPQPQPPCTTATRY